MLLLTLNEQEEKVIDKIMAAVSDYISLETVQTFSTPVISFSGLEIRQHQRRVLRIMPLSFLEGTLVLKMEKRRFPFMPLSVFNKSGIL
ncbi:MAG: hypothetical protein HDR01_00490 [Lachnospiraceae bacterium]|nr:hypothetical protein [Lachnospiraceae bacterium]